MVISDEKRREVAENLRNLTIGRSIQYKEQFFDELAEVVVGFEDYHDFDVIFEKLADLIEPCPIDGETSDGYHTFNELYHHRAVLFSVIVAAFDKRAWKSKLHADGTMYDGMFIVGIETPDGQATYHYDIDPYWDMFRCTELGRAPEWDGHTPNQAIERIGKLADLIDRPAIKPEPSGRAYWRCPRCGAFNYRSAVTDCCGVIPAHYCANCGAEVVG